MTPDEIDKLLQQKKDEALERILRDIDGPGVVLDAKLFDTWWQYNYQVESLLLKIAFYPDNNEYVSAAAHAIRIREELRRQL